MPLPQDNIKFFGLIYKTKAHCCLGGDLESTVKLFERLRAGYTEQLVPSLFVTVDRN